MYTSLSTFVFFSVSEVGGRRFLDGGRQKHWNYLVLLNFFLLNASFRKFAFVLVLCKQVRIELLKSPSVRPVEGNLQKFDLRPLGLRALAALLIHEEIFHVNVCM